MGAYLFFALTWLLPLAGCPLLGAASYAGWFTPLTAFLLGWTAMVLRHGSLRGFLLRLPGAGVSALVLISAGVVGAHAWFSLAPAAPRVTLVLLGWSVLLTWFGVGVLKPALLTQLKIPTLPLPKTQWGIALGVLFLLPLVGRVGSEQAVPDFVHTALEKKSLEVKGDLITIDPTPRGLASLFRETRHVALGHRKNMPEEVYLIRVRHDYSGAPTALGGVYNLSRTAAVAESDLSVAGQWLAWKVGQSTGPQRLEVANLAGETPDHGIGWDLLGRIQRFVTNIQEVGQGRGIARTVVSWIPPSRLDTFKLDRTMLTVSVGKHSLVWSLGGAVEEVKTEPGLSIETVPAPLPGSLVTWAVDRVRAISWIGSDRLQWIKAVVFKIVTEAEDVTEQISATDPESHVTEELGDVWSRLPVVEGSSFTGWPPAPLTPKIKDKLPGEGQWIDLTHEKAFSALKSPSMLFTYIRVDPKRAYNQVSIAIWDPRRIELHIVAGTEEPRSTLGQRGTGNIPRTPERVGRLVAAFNGAFQAVHGEFGMMEEGIVQLPPKPYAATISTHRDGRVKLGTWPGEPTPIPSDMVSFRQNMTALVGPGGVNPYRRHWWGGVPEGWTDESRTVRSSMCKTREGHLAYFYCAAIEPERLAEAMILAGCEYGVHLDMNGGHAGFEMYRVEETDKLPPVARPLEQTWEATGRVPEMPHLSFNARLLVRQMPLMNFPRYIQTTPRDFFYLTERNTLPGQALELPGPWGTDGWKAINTPGNESPPFLVRTDVAEKGSSAVSLSRIDPSQLVSAKNSSVLGFAAPLEGERGLYLSDGAFVVSAADVPGATLVARGGTQGNQALCVDADGMLTIVGAGANDAQLSVLLASLGCREILRLNKPLKMLLGNDAKDAPVAFGRAEPYLAGTLFPETPVVPPKVWGIPQAERARLIQAKK